MKILAQIVIGLCLLAWMWISAEVQSTSAQTAPQAPFVMFIAFSPEVSPSDSLPFRQAVAYAIDRDAVAKAVSVDPQAPILYPALTIQHPKLAGFNPDAPAYGYDAAKAKTLYAQSGWRGPVTISISKAPAGSARAAMNVAVRDSIRRTLGADVILQEAPSLDRLLVSARRGQVPAFISGWRSDPRDYGYPSFALGLADDLGFGKRDPDLSLLISKGDAKAVEQVLLEKALIVPIVRN